MLHIPAWIIVVGLIGVIIVLIDPPKIRTKKKTRPSTSRIVDQIVSQPLILPKVADCRRAILMSEDRTYCFVICAWPAPDQPGDYLIRIATRKGLSDEIMTIASPNINQASCEAMRVIARKHRLTPVTFDDELLQIRLSPDADGFSPELHWLFDQEWIEIPSHR